MQPLPQLKDITAIEAHRMLRADDRAVLVDVRSEPEWDFVGVPLVANYVQVCWRAWPDMRVCDDFLDEFAAFDIPRDAPLLMLCKSGGRSRQAGLFLLQNGYARCYNVRDGFEGDRNDHGQRRCVNGWIASGLPWMQC